MSASAYGKTEKRFALRPPTPRTSTPTRSKNSPAAASMSHNKNSSTEKQDGHFFNGIYIKRVSEGLLEEYKANKQHLTIPPNTIARELKESYERWWAEEHAQYEEYQAGAKRTSFGHRKGLQGTRNSAIGADRVFVAGSRSSNRPPNTHRFNGFDLPNLAHTALGKRLKVLPRIPAEDFIQVMEYKLKAGDYAESEFDKPGNLAPGLGFH